MISRWAAGVLTLTVLYFAYHAFAGEQGLGSWSDMQAEISDKKKVLRALEQENAALQKDIAMLSPQTADPDLIETLARSELGFVYPEELILIDRTATNADVHR